ncbi:RNA polymerase sigma factor [Ilumatobacter sp.]|uniref:RNA polymerase sigma factor n=1 Tax=Ilumatobacter sp. TaxID=1967498 RepID=UPI003C39BB38
MPLTGAAAARLYDDHVVAVHALIARRVGPSTAPAITSETFELALRTWDQFDSERGTERLFLYGAATTTLRRHAETERAHLRSLRIPTGRSVRSIDDPLFSTAGDDRPRARVVEHESNNDLLGAESDDDSTPISTVHDDSDTLDGRVMRAVAELDADDRDIVLLSIWESCSQSEIAETLAMSVGNVRSSLGRIRRELKLSAGG